MAIDLIVFKFRIWHDACFLLLPNLAYRISQVYLKIIVVRKVTTMNKVTVLASVLLVLTGFGTVIAQDVQPVDNAAAKLVVKKQAVCPVMGGEVNTNIFADANGKRVYFCCKGCPAEFKKDPAKYIDKLEKDGVTLDKTPAADQPKVQTKDAGAAPVKAHDHSAMKGGGGCNM